MSRSAGTVSSPQIIVELGGGIAEDLGDYARRKIAAMLDHTSRPALHTRLRVIRHGDPGRERPVTAQLNVHLGGRRIRVRTEAATPREAVDSLVERLGRQVRRASQEWDARRGRMSREEPHEWRHDSPPARRRRFYPRPPDERQIVRHQTVSPARCTVDRAIVEMDDQDYDFHLFLEVSREVDSVVYRAGPTGVRLAQLDGRADLVAPSSAPWTASTQRAPLLDLPEAVERLRLVELPFLFYLDADHGRGCVLYRRYDGHYGLIDPLLE